MAKGEGLAQAREKTPGFGGAAGSAGAAHRQASQASDEQLALAAAGGDRSALEALIERMRPRLVHFLIGKNTSRADAEDLAHDALVKAMENLDRYEQRCRFSTWLFTIAMRLRIDRHRKARRHRQQPIVGTLRDPARPFDQQVDDRDAAGNIWATARRLLSDTQYKALWLRYGEQMDSKQIARVMGRTAVGVRVLLMRARNQLVEALDDGEPRAAPATGQTIEFRGEAAGGAS